MDRGPVNGPLVDCRQDWQWPAVAILVLIAWFVTLFGYHQLKHDHWQLEQVLANERSAAAEDKNAQAFAVLRSQTIAHQAQYALEKTTERIRHETHNSITELSRHRDQLLERLREHEDGAGPDRRALPSPAAATAPGAAAGCGPRNRVPATAGGARDFRGLVDEAHRADQLRVALSACYAQYDAARQMVEDYGLKLSAEQPR